MEYTLLRLLHVGTVYVTFALFLLRGFWMLLDSPRLCQPWIRILPHVNDTLLLVAAIGLVMVGNWGTPPWVIAKIIGLLAYIGLGTVALKRGRTKATRVKAFIAALGMFGYIIAVAVTKQVVPGLL
ncbi:MAG: SirB2 family protein [Thiobacillaceae bacterium]|jgi:uncharacterized membrane protein SirB2|nr:SirB2 family protein [Thiobacillaceae bacterium]